MPDDFKIKDLARRVKEKYPEYAEVDDTELATRVATKYPEYGEYIGISAPSTSADNILAKMRGSVMTQESGGSQRVQNPRTSATGLFQVMPANIPNWTKKYYGKSLTQQEFANDRNAQETVFKGEMGKYINQALKFAKGDEDKAIRMAAAAWYGGEGNMRNYDANWGGKGNEPTFREYTTSVLNRIKKGQPPSLAPQANPLVEQGIIEPTVYTAAPEQELTPIDESAWSGIQPPQTPQVAAPQIEVPQDQPEMPDAPTTEATDADFAEANKYLASVGQPLLTREQFNAAQVGFGKGAQATSYQTGVDIPQAKKAVTPVPAQKVAQNAPKQQETSTPQGVEITFKYDPKDKRTYGEQERDAMASQFAGQLGIDADIVRDYINRKGFAEGNESESEREAQAKAGVSQRRKLDASAVADLVKIREFTVKKRAEIEKEAQEKLTQYTNELEEGMPTSVARIRTEFDMGGMSEDEFLKRIAEEKTLAKNLRSQSLDASPLDLRGITATRLGVPDSKVGGDVDIKENNKLIDSILERYPTLTAWKKEQDRLQKEYQYRPLAAPLEFAKGVFGAVPKAVASVLKSADLAMNLNPLVMMKRAYEDGKPFQFTEGVLSDIGNGINRYVDSTLNKDFDDNRAIRVISDTIGQALTQVAAGVLSGGATVPTALGFTMGASSQFDEANKFKNATDEQKAVAWAVGGLAAVPDAVIFSKGGVGGVLDYAKGLTKSLLARFGVEYGEKAAAEMTEIAMKSFAKRFMANAPKNAAFEVVQEVSENKINNAVASITYDPSEKRIRDANPLHWNEEDTWSAIGAIVGGGSSAVIQAKVESIPETEREDFIDELNSKIDTLVKQKSITPEQAAKAKREIVTLEPVATPSAEKPKVKVEEKPVEKVVDSPIISTNAKGNFVVTVGDKLGEIKTQRNDIDKELGTISIINVRVSENIRQQGIATQMYETLRDNLPSDIKGIRLSDVTTSDAIPAIYKKLGAVKQGDELIIPNPNYKPTKPKFSETPKELDSKLTTIDKDEGVAGTGFRRRVVEEPVEKPGVSIKEPDTKVADDVNIKTPVAKKLDAVKQLQQEKREALAEIEDEAKELKVQGQAIEAKKLRDDITAEYNGKILKAKKKPAVEAKAAPLTPTKPKVAPQPVETPKKILSTQTDGSDLKVGDKVKRVVEYGGEKIIRHGTVEQTKSGLRVIERDTEASHPLQGWSKGTAPLASAVNASDIIDSKGNVNYERAKDVAGRIERGDATIRRLNPSGEQGRIKGGQRNVEASIILAANERASEKSGSRTHPIKRQERVLEEYAKREGVWFDVKEFTRQRQGYIGKGQEAYVHRADDKSVYKLIDYKKIDEQFTPQDFIDNRLSAFNYIFPETAYELTGFTRDSGGDFRFIVKQPFIQDVVYTTASERQAFMKSKGFEMIGKYGEQFANQFYYVSDLHEKNALKAADGTIYVIDAVVKAKPVGDFEISSKPLASAVNASGESAASLEAQSRLKGEQARGEYRVVVDTRSGAETKLFGVNAVDHFKLQPYQQTEWRGGKRDGEIIDRGSATRAYIRKTAPLAMVAWHGSPHKFDKFDSSKIGTGEGAQAYGHGLYFTDKEGVADYYKNTLSQTKRFTPEYDAIVKEVTEQFDPEWNKAIENFKRLDLKYGTSEYRTAEAKVNDVHERRRKEIERRVALKTGSKYKVDLKPEADEYLLWDKPLSEQSEKVKKAVDVVKKRLANNSDHQYQERRQTSNIGNGQITGAAFYNRLNMRGMPFDTANEVSEYLKSLGIRGIKYLDGTSRSKGEGSYNYVIFDDTDVEIQEVLAKVPTKATPEMEAAVTYDTGRLATKAKFEVDGSTISLDNLDAYGIAHQAMQIFDPNYTHFFGVTLDGAQIKEVRTAMRKFAKDAIFTKAEKEGFNRFIKAIDTAAKANPKPTVKFILMPEAIAHESAHEARIQTMATASVEGSQSKDWIKGVVSSPLFKRSTIADRYGRVSDAVQALEFIDQLIAKSYDELGLDPDTNANEIVDAIQAWADDFIKTNGEVDWKYYEKLNEVNSHLISLISETKGGDTKNTVKQEAERGKAKADSKAVGAKPQKLKSRTPGKSGVEFDETEAQEAKKQGQKVAALSKQLGYELYYDPQSEDATDIKASQLLEKIGVQSAIEQALYGKPNPASSRVLDWELERLSAVAEAHKELGNDAEYAATMDYYSDLLAGAAMRRIQTGREVQSYRRLGSLTPVSAQLVAQKLKKLAFGDDAKLTPEQTKQVEDLAKELQAAVKQIEKSNIIIAEQQRIIDNADETDTKTPLNRQEALLNNYKKKEKIILAELEKRFPTSPLFKGNAPLAMAMESDVVLDAKTEGLLKDYTIGQILTNRSYENVISEIREISGVSLEQAKDIHAIAADEIRGASEPVSAEAKKRIQIRKEHYAEADKHAHPEKAAKKAIGLAETSLKRQIETLEKEIATGEKAVKQKGKVTSPEIERLKRDRDALKTERDTLLGTGLTEQQKVDRAIKAVRKSINNTTEKIKANDLAVIRKQPVNSDELTALRAEQKTLRSILNDMRREAKKTQTQVSGLSKIAQQAVEFYPEDYELIAVINYLTQQKPKSINEALNYLQKTFGFQITEAKEIAIKAQQAIDRIKASNKVAAEKAKGIKDSEQAKLDAATRKATQESLKLNRFLKNFGQNPNAIKRFNNDFRAKLISNYGTQLFNFIQSFTVSTPATAMLDMIEAGYRALGVNIGEATDVQALDAFRTYLFLSGTNRQLAIDALSMFPEQYYTVHAGLMGDIELELQPLAGEKTNPIAKGVHWWFDKNDKLNRWLAHKTGAKYQEMLFRNAVVASTFDNIIRKRTGGSLESAMKDGTFKDIITENDATRAAQRALEVTFASQIDDPFGKWLKRGYDKLDNYVPVLFNPVTYARFTYTATKVMVLNPLTFGGYDQAIHKLADKKNKTQNRPEYNTREIAKGTLAWSGVAVAYGLMSWLGGDDDKWYTIYPLGKDGPIWDVRRTFPLSSFFYMAHLIKSAPIIGDDSPPPTIKEFLGGFASLELEYFQYGPAADLVGEVGTAYSTQSVAKVPEASAALVASYFAGLLRFFKPAKDILAQAWDKEAAVREYDDSMSDKVIEQLSKSIPAVNALYDAPVKKDIQGNEVLMPFPLGRAFGINLVHPSFVSPKDSSATQWANKVWKWTGTGEMTLEERKAYNARKAIQNAWRTGNKIKVEQALKNMETTLTPKSKSRLQDELKYSELGAKVKYNFGDNPRDIQALKTVWARATSAEKQEITKILKDKDGISQATRNLFK